MKSLLLILFCSTITSVSYGQNFVPFPDSAVIWVNATLVVNQGFYGSYYCANGEDTLINSTSYTKLEQCISGNYLGAFRDTVGKVYYVPSDSSSEYLLFDFYPMPGDTLHFYQEEFGPGLEEYIVQVSDTGTTQVNGQNRRTVSVGESMWVEGLGNTKGLMTSQFYNVSNYVKWLYCMSVNDTINYGYSVTHGHGSPQEIIDLPCDLYLGTDELSRMSFDVYPNPADDFLIFTLEGSVKSIEIVDAIGKKWSRDISFVNGEFKVQVSDLSKGMYTLKVLVNNKVYQSKFVKN